MRDTTAETHVTLTGSLAPVTEASSLVRNEPVGSWMPAIYDASEITDSGQWASENPF